MRAFIKIMNHRFMTELWTDSCFVDASSNFCLCSYCNKSDIVEGRICPIHEEFMQLTQKLHIAGPVFACQVFEELPNASDYLEAYYDGNALSREKSQAPVYEKMARIKEQWKAQQKRWSNMQQDYLKGAGIVESSIDSSDLQV